MEETKVAEFDSPDLWGIDPNEIWEWTPRTFREIVDNGEWDAKTAEWKRLPKYGKPAPGAPIFQIAPLSESLSLKLQAARSRYNIARFSAMKSVLSGGSAESAMDATDSAASKIYSEALMIEVLSACVKGWTGVKKRTRQGLKPAEFSGKWALDSVVMRADWQAELFNDIRTETLFEAEGQAESFTSSPESAAA